jgi:hypothetical protein
MRSGVTSLLAERVKLGIIPCMTNLTLSGIIDAIKLAPQHWFAVAIVSTVILLLPVAVILVPRTEY